MDSYPTSCTGFTDLLVYYIYKDSFDVLSNYPLTLDRTIHFEEKDESLPKGETLHINKYSIAKEISEKDKRKILALEEKVNKEKEKVKRDNKKAEKEKESLIKKKAEKEKRAKRKAEKEALIQKEAEREVLIQKEIEKEASKIGPLKKTKFVSTEESERYLNKKFMDWIFKNITSSA
jgi:FtsZ-interacting cell division protein YlmF